MQLGLKTKILNTLRLIFRIQFLEKWLCSRTQGLSSDAALTKLIPNNYQYAPNTIRKATRHGIHYYLDLNDLVDWTIYFGLQDAALERVFALCRPGDVVLDIGTNVGLVLLNVAQRVGAGGAVYGFEPDPHNYQRCQHNLQANDFPQAQVFNQGLGDTTGSFTLQIVDTTNRGMNRIVVASAPPPTSGTVATIQVTTLDEFVSDHKLQRINLIKIDVEGYELKVLQGGTDTLAKFRPTLMIEVIDSNLRQQGGSAAALIEFLENLGYKITDAETGEAILASQNFANRQLDILCAA